MQNAQLREDIEVCEVEWLFFRSEWVTLRRFGEILSACILVEDFGPAECQIYYESQRVEAHT